MSDLEALTIAVDHLSSIKPSGITEADQQRAIEHLVFSRDWAAAREARRVHRAEARRKWKELED